MWVRSYSSLNKFFERRTCFLSTWLGKPWSLTVKTIQGVIVTKIFFIWCGGLVIGCNWPLCPTASIIIEKMEMYECPNCKLRLKEPEGSEIWCNCRPRLKMKMIRVWSLYVTKSHLMEELIWCYTLQYNKPLTKEVNKILRGII